VAKPNFAEVYVDHLRTATIPVLQQLSGFVDASILRRSVPEGVEFLVVTRWVSLESIRAFAGTAIEDAVVPQNVRAMMVEYDSIVRHYEEVGPE